MVVTRKRREAIDSSEAQLTKQHKPLQEFTSANYF